MIRDIRKLKPRSSFLNAEKDLELLVKKVFFENPLADDLIRLLVINTPDCLDDKESEVYKNKVKEMTVSKLIKEGYVRTKPRFLFPEHEEVKSYILITFDNYVPNETNPEFRDCTVSFDIICHLDQWDLGNFRQRPLKIIGLIDGILDRSRLTGIGTFQFLGCKQMVIDNDISGYTLIYQAIHGSDDRIENDNE